MTDYAKPIRRSDPKTYTPHYLDGFEVGDVETGPTRVSDAPDVSYPALLDAAKALLGARADAFDAGYDVDAPTAAMAIAWAKLGRLVEDAGCE